MKGTTAPGLDIYALENEWRKWHEKNGSATLKTPMEPSSLSVETL